MDSKSFLADILKHMYPHRKKLEKLDLSHLGKLESSTNLNLKAIKGDDVPPKIIIYGEGDQ